MQRQFYVYMMTNKSHRVLYTGVTNDLERRLSEHRQKLVPGFTAKYNTTKLVYYETYNDAVQAITREKKIKGWLRKRKDELVNGANPAWKDLADEWRRPYVSS